MNKLRILFMGTPDFAASCLRALVASGENIVGCVTGADRARGRGMKLTPTPVKSAALEAGIPVFQPATLRGEDFAELLISLSPDLIIVAAYGKLLPENQAKSPGNLISDDRIILKTGNCFPAKNCLVHIRRALKLCYLKTILVSNGLSKRAAFRTDLCSHVLPL